MLTADAITMEEKNIVSIMVDGPGAPDRAVYQLGGFVGNVRRALSSKSSVVYGNHKRSK